MHFYTMRPEKSTCESKCFFQRCVPQAERDVHFVRDVSFSNGYASFAHNDGDSTGTICLIAFVIDLLNDREQLSPTLSAFGFSALVS